jgi:hypothetical protein
MKLAIGALACLLVATTARPALSLPPPAENSPEAAESLYKKLEGIERRKHDPSARRPESVVVTESELNSFLNLRTKMPRGLSDVLVRLEQERIHATGLLDLEQVRDRMPTLSPWSPLYWLTGQVGVLLRGRFLNHDGFGSIEWEDVRVGSVPVPLTLLDQIVASATKDEEHPEGFDIRAPFRLPYTVRRVRLEPGRAFLDF